MKKQLTSALTLITAMGLAAAIAGCQCPQAKKVAAAPAPVKVARVAPAPAPAPKPLPKGGCPALRMEGDKIYASKAFPTGDVKTSVVLLEKSAPAEVNVGAPYIYTLTATNLSDCQIDEVTITDVLPANVTMQSSDPQANVSGATATWMLGSLQPKESKSVTIKAVANASGEITNCARVTYVPNLCLTIAAVAPKLELTKTTPQAVLLCDEIPVKLVVSNTGTGVLRNVTVSDPLPAGLVAADGKNTVSFDAGSLAGGQSREFAFVAKATKTGEYKNTATAKSDSGLTADASSNVTVRQPVLAITKEGTQKVFAGRPIEYTITVSNKGDAAAKNVVITDPVPAGTRFMKASDGGQLAGQNITWQIANIEPNGSVKVTATVDSVQLGKVTNTASAQATCAAPVNATVSTDVAGIPAILLEVVDSPDPIEVGGTTTYTIVATNQGSINDNNIKIVCTLEDTQAYVSSSGATVGTAAGQVITFAPLATLAPKAKATWQVVIKAVKAGDVRFQTVMNTDMLTRPVQETEATNQY